MSSSHLERAERAIAAIRHQGGLSLELIEVLEEILFAIRSVDHGLATLQGKDISPPTAPNGIHLLDNHDNYGDHAKHILALLGER